MDQPLDRERVAWVTARKVGTTAAVFGPDQTVRCPGVAVLDGGRRVTCGHRLGQTKPGTTVIVRVQQPQRRPLPYPGIELRCPNQRCHAQLEEFATVAQRPLEATG